MTTYRAVYSHFVIWITSSLPHWFWQAGTLVCWRYPVLPRWWLPWKRNTCHSVQKLAFSVQSQFSFDIHPALRPHPPGHVTTMWLWAESNQWGQRMEEHSLCWCKWVQGCNPEGTEREREGGGGGTGGGGKRDKWNPMSDIKCTYSHQHVHKVWVSLSNSRQQNAIPWFLQTEKKMSHQSSKLITVNQKHLLWEYLGSCTLYPGHCCTVSIDTGWRRRSTPVCSLAQEPIPCPCDARPVSLAAESALLTASRDSEWSAANAWSYIIKS